MGYRVFSLVSLPFQGQSFGPELPGHFLVISKGSVRPTNTLSDTLESSTHGQCLVAWAITEK